MTSFSLLKVFLFDYLPDLMFELSEPPMRDCYDIQNSLSDVLECQKAASELGIIFDYEISSDSFPKGCSSGYNNVYWNTHDTGAIRKNYYPICRKDNKSNN